MHSPRPGRGTAAGNSRHRPRRRPRSAPAGAVAHHRQAQVIHPTGRSKPGTGRPGNACPVTVLAGHAGGAERPQIPTGGGETRPAAAAQTVRHATPPARSRRPGKPGNPTAGDPGPGRIPRRRIPTRPKSAAENPEPGKAGPRGGVSPTALGQSEPAGERVTGRLPCRAARAGPPPPAARHRRDAGTPRVERIEACPSSSLTTSMAAPLANSSVAVRVPEHVRGDRPVQPGPTRQRGQPLAYRVGGHRPPTGLCRNVTSTKSQSSAAGRASRSTR